MRRLPPHTVGSGNVFADLGLPNADELLVKAGLVLQISRIVEQRGLTQVQAARAFGIDQPKVSALLHGHLRGFSVERLTRFLNALGQDVDIVVRPTTPRARQGQTRVVARRRTAASSRR